MLKISIHAFALAFLALTTANLSAFQVEHSTHAFRQQRRNQAKGGVRIFLDENRDENSLKVEGGYGIYDPARNMRITGGVMTKTMPLIADKEGLSWGEIFPDLYQMTIVPEGHEEGFYLNDRYYLGVLYAYLIEGKLALVNELTLDDFALAITSQEMSNGDLEKEALASLAICARSFALAGRQQHKEAQWHLEARRVGFKGFKNRSSLEEARSALVKTRDLILQSDQQRTLLSQWHGNCAGQTIAYDLMHRVDRIFRTSPTSGVFSPWAKKERLNKSWRFSISENQISQLLSLTAPLQIKLERDADSNKVYQIEFRDAREAKQLNFYLLQKILGPQIQSSDFTIEQIGSEKKIVFSGFGQGDGVGLCIFSANAMAKEGKTAKQILSYFFPNSRLSLLDLNLQRARV